MAKDTATAPAPRSADKVRNVALVGHAGAGKTTLAEALLVATGALPRAGRVEEGTTCLDTEEVEVRQQRSVSLGVATVEHQDHRITLLDTPGSPDFVGELRAGLRAADAALFVVSAVNGVDATTEQLWAECAAVGMPRAVVITQLDRARADVEDAVRLCQRQLGDGVFPMHLLDRGPDGAVTGLVSLLEPHVDAPDADRLRGELIEGIIGESEDETLMERYLSGDELAVADLVTDLETAVARGHFHPVLCVAPLTGVGVPELLDLLVAAFPCPKEHGCPPVTRPDGKAVAPIECDPDGPLVAEVVKTTTDPYLGRVSLVRVFSGTLRPDIPIHVSGHGMTDRGHPDHDVDERIGAVSSRWEPRCARSPRARPATSAPSPGSAAPRPVTRCPPRTTRASSRRGTCPPRSCRWRWRPPPARTRTVSRPPWPASWPRTPPCGSSAGPTPVSCCCGAWGEAHAEVLLERLRSRHGVGVNTVPVRVPMVETLAAPGRVTGRHVKQSGGHGQYAVVVVEGEPGPPGSGVVFEQRIVGGTVPSQFHGSVEKGVRTQAERGDRRRPPARRRPRDARRREVALGRLLRRGVPGRRGTGAARTGRGRGHPRARALVRDRGRRPR